MSTWLLVNAVLSITVLIGTKFLSSAPPKLNLWLCLFALICWLIPWHELVITVSHPQVLEAYATLQPMLPIFEYTEAVSVDRSYGWEQILLGSTLFGFSGFCVRFWLQQRTIRIWSSNATTADQLWHQHGFHHVKIPIFVVENFNDALVSGYQHPRIWLGLSQAHGESTRSILQHELVHIQQKDNFTLLFITLIKDLFWWNPLVALLTSRSRAFIELNCDLCCQSNYPEYQQQLAVELLRNQQHPGNSFLLAPYFSKPKFNIYRLKQLDEEFNMKTKNVALIALILSLSLTTIAVPALSKNIKTAQIVNHLTVSIKYGDGDLTEHVVDFIGEPEIQRLLKTQVSGTLEIKVGNPVDGRREAFLKGDFKEVSPVIDRVFSGSKIKHILHNVAGDKQLSGNPIFLDLIFTPGDQDPITVTITPDNSVWTGIDFGDHLLRIKPTLIPESTSVDIRAEISEKINGKFSVIARPRVITELEKSTLIKNGLGKNNFSLNLVVSLP